MKPNYTGKPIGYVESLAKAISTDKNIEFLTRIASDAGKFFVLKERIEKPNGTFRDIYTVKDPLKAIQGRIVNQMIRKVEYPIYLQGSIKDEANPRSDITNAQLHVNRRLVIRMDITNFFPSISANKVTEIWKQFFHFPPDVALTLTQLVTYNGFLPQGVATSPGLANLLFWDIEPGIVANLEKRGFYYSRYVDDVTISADHFVNMRDLEPIISSVFGMFKIKNVAPNREKLEILTNGHALKVHNLNVNAQQPTMPKDERNRIRAAVKECENVASGSGRYTDEYETLWQQTSGRVQRMILLGHRSSKDYKLRLEAIIPLVSQDLVTELEQKITALEAMGKNRRYTQQYALQYQSLYDTVQRKLQFAPKPLRPLWLRLKVLPSSSMIALSNLDIAAFRSTSM